MKRTIFSDKAPKPVGPYSHATVGQGLIFVSGQLAVDPANNEFVEKDIQIQTRQILENIRAILAEAGADLSDILKVNIYIDKMSNFEKMNKVYEEYFPEDPPARCCIAVGEFPPGVMIEIDVIAGKR